MGGANDYSAKKGGDAVDVQGRRKNRIFAPVTMKMIQDA